MLTMNFTKGTINSPNTDAEKLDSWFARMAQGDTQALADLYHSTKSDVYAFALSILKNTQDAEDVLHDCYVNLYRSAPSYRPAGKPLAFILTVARNLCLHQFRNRKNSNELPQEDWETCLEHQAGVTPEDKLFLWECMNSLNDEERQIVTLHAVSALRHREIAHMLNLPLSTVLSKYNRAIKKLQKKLKGENK